MPGPRTLPSLQADIRLAGTVDDGMLREFLRQLDQVSGKAGPVVIELTTTGGDADVGRRIACDVRLALERDCDLFFLGKSTVYSAGVTVMAAFPVERRFLTRDASVLVHERKLEKKLDLAGPLRTGIALLTDLLAQLEHGQELERDGFADLVRGSSLSLDEVLKRVQAASWYLRGDEALRLGLVAGLV